MKKTEYKALAHLFKGTAETFAWLVHSEADKDSLFVEIYSTLYKWSCIFEKRAKGG